MSIEFSSFISMLQEELSSIPYSEAYATFAGAKFVRSVSDTPFISKLRLRFIELLDLYLSCKASRKACDVFSRYISHNIVKRNICLDSVNECANFQNNSKNLLLGNLLLQRNVQLIDSF